MHEYTPANVPGLPAGWEINHDTEHNNLSLWRVVAYLKEWQEDRGGGGWGPLVYSCGRFADAYLPEGYTQDDVDFALGELVWKAKQFDNIWDENPDYYDWIPKGTDRPTRHEYFRKLR